MQAVCSTSSSIQGAALARRSSVARPAACRTTVCRAQQSPARKAVAAAAAAPAFLAAHPALALVDDRLAGEGTGTILGGAVWPVLLVGAAVWAVFYSGQGDMGGGKGDDSGLGL